MQQPKPLTWDWAVLGLLIKSYWRSEESRGPRVPKESAGKLVDTMSVSMSFHGTNVDFRQCIVDCVLIWISMHVGETGCVLPLLLHHILQLFLLLLLAPDYKPNNIHYSQVHTFWVFLNMDLPLSICYRRTRQEYYVGKGEVEFLLALNFNSTFLPVNLAHPLFPWYTFVSSRIRKLEMTSWLHGS